MLSYRRLLRFVIVVVPSEYLNVSVTTLTMFKKTCGLILRQWVIIPTTLAWNSFTEALVLYNFVVSGLGDSGKYMKAALKQFLFDLTQSFKNATRGLRVTTWRFKYLGWSAYFYERHTGDQKVTTGWQVNAGIVAITYGV